MGQRVEQRRLADAALARHHDRARGAAPALGERLAQALELGAAADDARRGEQLLARAGDQPVELARDGRRVLRPVGGIGGDQGEDQPVQRLGDARHAARRRLRRAHPEQVLGVERPHAAQQLVERHAEGEEVRQRRRGVAERLLGRGVAGRAGGRRGLALVDGHAEVAERGLALGVDPDVVGLDVAVHDAVRVGVRERLRDLAAGRDHLLRLEPPGRRPPEPVRQRAAGHVAGDEARRATRPRRRRGR